MGVRPLDDKSPDTLVVVPGEGSWTGSSTLPHLHQHSFEAPDTSSVRGFGVSGRVARPILLPAGMGRRGGPTPLDQGCPPLPAIATTSPKLVPTITSPSATTGMV